MKDVQELLNPEYGNFEELEKHQNLNAIQS
jgi:hypothetical protein